MAPLDKLPAPFPGPSGRIMAVEGVFKLVEGLPKAK